jgi:hypothetical protein
VPRPDVSVRRVPLIQSMAQIECVIRDSARRAVRRRSAVRLA